MSCFSVSFLHTKISDILEKHRRDFMMPWDKEEKFLESLDFPKTDIDRSYLQYQCQRFAYNNSRLWCFLNLVSAVAFFPTLMFLVVMNLFCKRRPRENTLLARGLDEQLIPGKFKAPNKNITIMDRRKGRLSWSDFLFLGIIIRKYPFSPYFLLKCTWMIAVYSYAIREFCPDYILCSAEFSFTSSILTMYCERKNIYHCNVAHGIVILDIIKAFPRFTWRSFWDKHDMQLVEELHGTASHNVIYLPQIPQMAYVPDMSRCTYYLQNNSAKELITIKELLKTSGKQYKVRPHPMFMIKEIWEIFEPQHIENPFEVDIWTSIATAGFVVSAFSSVVYQALLAHIPVVIDDIIRPQYFEEIKKRKHIIFSKPYQLLSSLM